MTTRALKRDLAAVEMEGLSREMGEWSLLDEVGDMRGARRELDGREAPARPLDNQVL